MGKALIINDISFAVTNLGQVTFSSLADDNNSLRITALSNLTISFPHDLEYNDGRSREWKLYTADTLLVVKSGRSVIFRSNIIPTQANGIGTFSITGSFTVSGDPLTLLADNTIANYAFKYLFKDCTGLTDAYNLVLPYVLAQGCCEGMFKGCTSLVETPPLTAAVLVTDCYKEMFYGCSSVNILRYYAATQLGETYTSNWTYGVSATGTFKQSPNLTYTESGVHGIPSGWTVDKSYNLSYFTITSLEDNNTISIEHVSTTVSPVIKYSLDNGVTWSTLTSDSGTKSFGTINTNEYIIFSSINNQLASDWDKYNSFKASKTFKVHGNIMSLLYGDDFLEHSEFGAKTMANFAGLFRSAASKLIDAENLILPALTCTSKCYNGMFRGCSNLTTAPALPATVSNSDCYSSMFEGCINLEEAPEINLQNMTSNCCGRMFCMSRTTMLTTPKMTKSPILRVATGVTNCYQEMFEGNGNLTEITCLMTSNFNCANWLRYASTTGTFKKAASASWPTGESGIPSGWTVETYVES